jgi:uncharacterized protein YcgL (UPF0745 family)
MKIDIYQSTKNRSAYISVPENTNLDDISITSEEAKLYGDVKDFKKSLNIDSGDKRVALNSDDVIIQIQEKGYAIHGAKIDFIKAGA